MLQFSLKFDETTASRFCKISLIAITLDCTLP